MSASVKKNQDYDRESSILLAKNVTQLLDREITARFEKINAALQSIAYIHQLNRGKARGTLDFPEYIREHKRLSAQREHHRRHR